MKVEIDVDMDQIAKGMNKSELSDFLLNFQENVIMDAIEQNDYERGDWIFLERMIKFVAKLSVELKSEIEDAINSNHISKEAYKTIKIIQKAELKRK